MTFSDRVEFDVWGARGSRSLAPPSSRVANYTSCYSVRSGSDLFVFDGGRGLGVLSHALATQKRFRAIERISLLLSHAHMDHWEGLKDATWFWTQRNGLKLQIFGAQEALDAVEHGYAHPAYVPLEVLASVTLSKLGTTALDVGERKKISGWTLRTFALNHYSGVGVDRNRLETLGYRLQSPEGFVLAYLCDHEPTDETVDVETKMFEGAHLAIVDAHFPDRADHAFGHGSQEHAAELARRHPDTLVLAAHHGPTFTDDAIRGTYRRYSRGLKNFALATESTRLNWSRRTGKLSTRT